MTPTQPNAEEFLNPPKGGGRGQYAYQPPPKRHKYGVAAKEDRTADGIVFASQGGSPALDRVLSRSGRKNCPRGQP